MALITNCAKYQKFCPRSRILPSGAPGRPYFGSQGTSQLPTTNNRDKFNFSPVFPLMYICGSEPPTVGLSIRLLLKYIYGSDYSLYLMYFSGSNHPCLSDMHVKLLIIFMVRFEQGHEGGEIEVSSLRWRISVSYRFTIITVYCRRK